MALSHSGREQRRATQQDVKSIIGDIDQADLLSIMELRPTIKDLEDASMWLSGDPDVFGSAAPLKDVPERIVEILRPEEDDDNPGAR